MPLDYQISFKILPLFSFSVAEEAPKRKSLPAWIRDGLTKMDKNKSKTRTFEDVKKPPVSEVTGFNTRVTGRVTNSSIQRNRISGYSAMNDSDASSDENVSKNIARLKVY